MLHASSISFFEREPMDSTTPSPNPPAQKRDQGGLIGGLVLIVLGLLFLANNLIPDFHFGDYWPVILIVIGGFLLWKSRSELKQ
jgi:phage shock protein C